jgi:4'-phosphopantetheinyl transferase
MGSEEANVWIARPQEVGDEQMRSLELTLDAREIERATKFRFENDRRAYVVAHGLRRIALGDWLGVDPVSLVLAKQSSGRPVLVWPRGSRVYFSHAHTRELVAFAIATVGPVGIDVECVAQTKPDFDLLAPYVVLPEVSERVAELGINLAGQFYFYWTALEAFWKAAGTGLSPGNPRILCKKNDAGTFEITLEGDVGDRPCLPRATLSRIQAPEGCMISLAQQVPHGAVGRAGAPSLSRIGRCRRKDDFFQRTKRHQGSAYISIVSV